jgi:hypothetical protein
MPASTLDDPPRFLWRFRHASFRSTFDGAHRSPYLCKESLASEGMMTTFDKREEGFEKKFAHDEELKFKATARRNRLLGLWAAAVLGKTGADADAYSKEVVAADFEEAGDDDVVRKVAKDLAGKASEPEIRSKMQELLAEAVKQIQAGQ